MERSLISSHALSAVLHALFLLLAFMAPVVLVLDAPPVWVADGRVARIDFEDVVIETGFRFPLATERVEESGYGTAPGHAEGDEEGAAPRTVAKSDPPDPLPQIADEGGAAFIEDVSGLLEGFADETLGPDSEIALGELDEGGGRTGAGGFGFGMGGGGASCWGSWRTNAKGKRTVEYVGCPEAPFPGGGHGWGELGVGVRQIPEPDLGDKDEAKVRPTVITAAPIGCPTVAACPWKAIIEKVIKRHRRELTHCYDRALDRQQREFSANVDVSFAIAPGGGTAQVEFASSSGVARFDSCVQARVASWIFPETGHDIRANYPFRFDVL